MKKDLHFYKKIYKFNKKIILYTFFAIHKNNSCYIFYKITAKVNNFTIIMDFLKGK